MGRCSRRRKIKRLREVEADTKSLSEKNMVLEVKEKREMVSEIYAFFQDHEGIKWYRIDPMENNPISDDVVDDRGGHWYKIKPDELQPVCRSKRTDLPSFFGACSWKSKIFLFGGDAEIPEDEENEDGGSRSIYVSDMKMSVYHLRGFAGMSWGRAKGELLARRCFPRAVSVNNKIYIFGCRGLDFPISASYTPNPWAEMYDPKSGTTTPLPDPPSLIKKTGCIEGFAVIDNGDNGDKIVFSGPSLRYVFSFNTHTLKWGRVATPLNRLHSWNLRTTVQDQVLYVFSSTKLLAYDLLQDKWFKKPVQGLDILSQGPSGTSLYDDPGYVFSMGNGADMCLVWSYSFAYTAMTTLCWLRFSVSSSQDELGDPVLLAHIKSSAIYSISPGFCTDCVALS